MKIGNSALVLFLAVLSASCSVREAHAPQASVAATQDDLVVRSFPRANITFNDTQLFLWKKGAQPSDVALVLGQSDQYEALKVDLFRLKSERKELKGQFDEFFKRLAEVKPANPDDPNDPANVDVSGIDIVNLPEKDESLPEKQEELAKLAKQIEDLQREPDSDDKKEKLSKLTRKQDVKKKQIAPILRVHAALKDAQLEGQYAAWKQLNVDLAQKQSDASAALAPIDETVWVFNSSPIKFSFSFETNHTIKASLTNWDLTKINDPEVVEEGVAHDFGTDLFTMGKVRYAELGGVFTFEVYTPRAIYWFKIARNNYAARDGRIHYKGDIIRCSVTDGFGIPLIVHNRDLVTCGVSTDGMDLSPDQVGHAETRRGAANLVDQDIKD